MKNYKTVCPKCGKELMYEQCYNSDPIGMPLFWRFYCSDCKIASLNGKDWWTRKDIAKASIHRDDPMIREISCG